jgi:hypothetical protein
MNTQLNEIVYAITLKPGEPLSLPEGAANILGPGDWLVSIRPAGEPMGDSQRDHSAFLASYAPEDDGLYDDFQAR